jgi:hypothetical protein
MDAIRRVSLSQPKMPPEFYANRVGALPVRGTLMGEPYNDAMAEVFYWESFGTPRERLAAMATEQGIRVELGEELKSGGMKRVFLARFEDYSGRWIEGVAKIYDRELVAQAFGTTTDQITDQLMAMVIQRDQFIRKVTQEAAERFMYNYAPHAAVDGSHSIQRLSIYVPRSFANSTLGYYGIELQELARGNPLHWAASTTHIRPVHTFTSMGLRSEYIDYQLFVEQLEADLQVLLAEFINKSIYQLFMKGRDEEGPGSILDLSLDRNANAEFRVPTDGGLPSVVISPYDP